MSLRIYLSAWAPRKFVSEIRAARKMRRAIQAANEKTAWKCWTE